MTIQHPAWCSPDHCEADDTSVTHVSAPTVAEGDGFGQLHVQLSRMDEPRQPACPADTEMRLALQGVVFVDSDGTPYVNASREILLSWVQTLLGAVVTLDREQRRRPAAVPVSAA